MTTPPSHLPPPQHDLTSDVLFDLPCLPPEDGAAASQIVLGICIRCIIICAVLYLLPWICDKIHADRERLGAYDDRTYRGKLRLQAWVVLAFTVITLAGSAAFDLCRILFFGVILVLRAWA